jgi:hypothetical protein
MLLALGSFEAGRLFLGLSLMFVGPIGLLYALMAVVSWIFGIPGERQRRNQLRTVSMHKAAAKSPRPSDLSQSAVD